MSYIKQVIIKDTKIVLTPAHIKSYMLMTIKGLEYLHANWILHRVTHFYISSHIKKEQAYDVNHQL